MESQLRILTDGELKERVVKVLSVKPNAILLSRDGPYKEGYLLEDGFLDTYKKYLLEKVEVKEEGLGLFLQEENAYFLIYGKKPLVIEIIDPLIVKIIKLSLEEKMEKAEKTEKDLEGIGVKADQNIEASCF